VASLARQRVYGLALRYEDVNDHDALRHDPLVAVLAESTATVPTEIVLDLDATDDPVHGAQDGRFFHGYYGHYCYLPLYLSVGEHLLCARLRPANIDARAGALEEVERIVAQLRTAWPTVAIILRADSGFCRDALITWCETHGVDHAFGLAKNARLIALIQDELADAATPCATTERPARVFAERTYQTVDSWSCARRVIAKAEPLTPATADGEGKRHPRFVVPSLALAAGNELTSELWKLATLAFYFTLAAEQKRSPVPPLARMCRSFNRCTIRLSIWSPCPSSRFLRRFRSLSRVKSEKRCAWSPDKKSKCCSIRIASSSFRSRRCGRCADF